MRVKHIWKSERTGSFSYINKHAVKIIYICNATFIYKVLSEQGRDKSINAGIRILRDRQIQGSILDFAHRGGEGRRV